MKSIQYTIRNIPEQVDEALRARALETRQSFNQTLIQALETATGHQGDRVHFDDLDWFIGSRMQKDEHFDEAKNWLDSLPKDLER